jgi:hypothetical protein
MKPRLAYNPRAAVLSTSVSRITYNQEGDCQPLWIAKHQGDQTEPMDHRAGWRIRVVTGVCPQWIIGGRRVKDDGHMALKLTARTSSAPFWIIRSMESLTNVLAVNRERRIFVSPRLLGNEEGRPD